MTRIVSSLAEISGGYRAVFMDLWGCLHDGVRPFDDAVEAMRAFKAGGGIVVLVTNSPRPRAAVARQLEIIGVPEDCWDTIASSGDSARTAMYSGAVGTRVHHIGTPEEASSFFTPDDVPGETLPIERVPLDEAEGIVVTGPRDDVHDMPEDYRPQFLAAKQRRLKLLCANPDLVVDRGERRVICAGALAAEYGSMGGESLYFGKPHPPIYDLARRRLAEIADVSGDDVLCIGDGIGTDVAGAQGEGLDCLFVTGGLAAAETNEGDVVDEARLLAFLRQAMVAPTYAIAKVR